jgi:hypothetical protein
LKREFYSECICNFCKTDTSSILGMLAQNNDFPLEQSQRDSWIEEIKILKKATTSFEGKIYFEYSIPRMGKRIDVLLLIGPIIFILEFKIGEDENPGDSIDQVWDYALDLKNFHETSQSHYIAPILVTTNPHQLDKNGDIVINDDKVLNPIKCYSENLEIEIRDILSKINGKEIDIAEWEKGRYQPSPNIIEAAMYLYNNHSVNEIIRTDATAKNLKETTKAITEIIRYSKNNSKKSICFVTGVPGAGKTLVGLNIATQNFDKNNDQYSVFLSGNGPLVDILREALARDKVTQEKRKGNKIKLFDTRRDVKAFIQNIHHFRDECLRDKLRPPIEHVALFDEAQRAWNLKQTISFMRIKKHVQDFNQSEPEFLISCMNRHPNWAVIVCLVGGGQEINTGEAGISEWIRSLKRSFSDWDIYISNRLNDSEYDAGNILNELNSSSRININEDLHLSTSMRSFRSENVSNLIKQILDVEKEKARNIYTNIANKYPIVITRDISDAKKWLKTRARGTERYGIVASSQALRLKPYAVDVKSTINPIHWFLDKKEDVRSSFYLEDVATEFQIQGLELDWVCVIWDADFRLSSEGWEFRSFVGSRWNIIRSVDRKVFLKNAYRVLLTRARQGMVIVVPPGDHEDPTRQSNFYDPMFDYLKEIGIQVI